jgi:hypothetical protein
VSELTRRGARRLAASGDELVGSADLIARSKASQSARAQRKKTSPNDRRERDQQRDLELDRDVPDVLHQQVEPERQDDATP